MMDEYDGDSAGASGKKVEGGKVVGGYGQGSAYWDVAGSVYDGRNLQVMFVTDVVYQRHQ